MRFQILLFFLSLSLIAQVPPPVDYTHRPGNVWGQPVDGVQISLALNFKNIPTPSVLQHPDGSMTPTIAPPPPGSQPLLGVLALVKNISDKTVYLLADKTHSGIDPPVFIKVGIENGSAPQQLLNLHPAPFERQEVIALNPGQTALFIEKIPYAIFIALSKDSMIVAGVSIADSKPAQDVVVKPDAMSWSNSVLPPWDQLNLYFDQNK